ncbi:hypothetical protein MAR_035633, partial [Mya arenaria]
GWLSRLSRSGRVGTLRGRRPSVDVLRSAEHHRDRARDLTPLQIVCIEHTSIDSTHLSTVVHRPDIWLMFVT